MAVDEHDIAMTLRDLGDHILTEPDLERRAHLFETFLHLGSDIARDGFLGAIYALREKGMPAVQIAERHGVHHWTVNRWTNEYADRHSVKRLGRHERVRDAVPLPPHHKVDGLRQRRGTPTPGA